MKTEETIAQCPGPTEVHLPKPFWRRAVWMRLGALNGLIALSVILLSDQSMSSSVHSGSVRQAAQIQFMHGMATLACATFMNVGAAGARMAPGFFLSGILLYCLPIYGEALGLIGLTVMLRQLGLVAFVVGWLILAWSAGDIDKA